jgi:tetratricopeptide (TPR) repeat protein
VILVIVLVSTGGSAKAIADRTAAESSPATPASSTQTASSSTSTSHVATPSHAAAAATVATADTAATSSPTATPAQPATKKPIVAKRRISRGKKPVIVDYDKKPDPTPEQDEALTRARTDYAAGNHHLFAGETDAAISSYRQALAAYPNYVAGYRGLGLAFAQQGNKASALDAFKTYVKLAPTAKDVALIKKRIANLSPR